ncbi:MAG: threonine--tRNA ligase [Chloroflexi bacterium]|nr:threonine--tRNA ligase [Chloroflexota bacterium]
MAKQHNMPEDLFRVRHSLAHIMAEAVIERYPDAKPTIGPPVENGFYYDFAVDKPFTPEDLDAFETRMKQIVKGNHEFKRREVSEGEARQVFAANPYKIELIDGLVSGAGDDMGDEEEAPASEPAAQAISIYSQDTFTDLCRGPHVASTKEINPEAFKLTSTSGAYWRGDEHNAMLQRIYGVAFKTKQELDEYLQRVEEAKKRDHRKLGKELEIFIFDDEVGPGLPLWLPNGGILIDELERLAKEMELKAGYDRVRTPHLTKEDLFIKSGHLPYYAESMYPPMELEGVKYYVKPMNCPMHHKIFAARQHSYRDLPVRLAEYGTCYRYEKSGELFGLMRVRSMQMNDAHIYCAEDQFEQEFMGVIAFYLEYFRLFGIEKYVMRLSTHGKKGLGKKYIDNVALWLKTEDMVRSAMTKHNVPFVEVPDEAAFYGPKIDVQVWSVIGKEFSLATNQVDFAQPGRFNLTFVNREGKEETPLCIHRAPLGTHERMIGFLLEHYAGAFPVWLAPVQAMIIPIADRHVEYANQVAGRLRAEGMRASVDDSTERMQNKIRKAQGQKIPYMLVIGDKERDAGAVAVRLRTGEDLKAMPLEQFVARAVPIMKSRAPNL